MYTEPELMDTIKSQLKKKIQQNFKNEHSAYKQAMNDDCIVTEQSLKVFLDKVIPEVQQKHKQELLKEIMAETKTRRHIISTESTGEALQTGYSLQQFQKLFQTERP